MGDLFHHGNHHDELPLHAYLQQDPHLIRLPAYVSLLLHRLGGLHLRHLSLHHRRRPWRRQEPGNASAVKNGLVPATLIALTYTLLIFLIAWYAHRRKETGRSIIANPYVYSLSIAVYCTTWTFYGS